MSWFVFLLALAMPLAGQWPQFRGPDGQGHSNSSDPPLTWSETSNITWKTTLSGKGWSSPVVRNGAIWLTTATENGHSLRALAVDAAAGAITADVEVFRVPDLPSKHNKNSHASPTPILDGNRVYVHFGAQGTAALDSDGKVLWRNIEHSFRQGHGTGGSPVLHDGLLIFNADGTDRQSVVALDTRTGRTVWRASRGQGRMGYSTPL
ncbi:MAG: PQQ-binding-like beta-propeller repeat protein, partial [bacterium]|nr:PQQ-binding-like beta-propeller repeat protein [bacterium]